LLLAVAVGVLGLAVVPAGASAVVGGQHVAFRAVPWFISFPSLGCGGTLVAVDRVVTAAHCVGGLRPADLGRVRVGRQVRRVVHLALAPGWEAATRAMYPDDIAIVGLDAPVTRVRPVPLQAPRARLPRRVRLLGRGRTVAPGRGGDEEGQLREAQLAGLGDGACARLWRRHPRHGDRFSATRMLCAIDADGRAPLSSGCNGDSGGPAYSGTHRRPRLLGVISWGDPRCGAGHLPSVSAEVAHDRHFVLAPHPVWEPRPTGPAHISGDTRVGGTLICTPPAFDAPVDTITFEWRDRDFAVVATGPSYMVQARDSGHDISCEATASTAGGPTTTAASVVISR
jgi:Trypsin